MDIRSTIALVTGGGTGIGRACALGLARRGAKAVAITYSRSEDDAARTADDIRAAGADALVLKCDVRIETEVKTTIGSVVERLGGLDILVNNAGITRFIPLKNLDAVTDAVWNDIMDTNVTGTLRGCQIFGADMVKRRSGRIINIASLGTFVSFMEVTPYCASKAAVGSITKSLALEWAPYNVFVNAIAPGIFPTALNSAILDSPRGQELNLRTPMHRFGGAEELVTTALYLASDATSFTTGQIIPVDGGFLASAVNQ